MKTVETVPHRFVPSATFDGEPGRYCIICGNTKGDPIHSRRAMAARPELEVVELAPIRAGGGLIAADVHQILPQMPEEERDPSVELAMWALSDGSLLVHPRGWTPGPGSTAEIFREDNRGVEWIYYEHAEDGKLYRHEFRYPPRFYWLDGGAVHIVPIEGVPSLWEDL